jgi:hypothetical protein
MDGRPVNCSTGHVRDWCHRGIGTARFDRGPTGATSAPRSTVRFTLRVSALGRWRRLFGRCHPSRKQGRHLLGRSQEGVYGQTVQSIGNARTATAPTMATRTTMEHGSPTSRTPVGAMTALPRTQPQVAGGTDNRLSVAGSRSPMRAPSGSTSPRFEPPVSASSALPN